MTEVKKSKKSQTELDRLVSKSPDQNLMRIDIAVYIVLLILCYIWVNFSIYIMVNKI